ncbi:MAG: hypothetical protein ACOC3I_07460 [Verrucomicrobiota bacterium]
MPASRSRPPSPNASVEAGFAVVADEVRALALRAAEAARADQLHQIAQKLNTATRELERFLGHGVPHRPLATAPEAGHRGPAIDSAATTTSPAAVLSP